MFPHIETGLLEFLDRNFGCRVRWIDRYDGIAFVHNSSPLFFARQVRENRALQRPHLIDANPPPAVIDRIYQHSWPPMVPSAT
jgi:hypothetical protein